MPVALLVSCYILMRELAEIGPVVLSSGKR